MSRRRQPPVPTFLVRDNQKLITIAHHLHRWPVGHIEHVGADGEAEGWHLSWEGRDIEPSRHENALSAVAAACDAYVGLVQAEDEQWRQEQRWERAARRQGGAMARAVRIPMGGQPP